MSERLNVSRLYRLIDTIFDDGRQHHWRNAALYTKRFVGGDVFNIGFPGLLNSDQCENPGDSTQPIFSLLI